MLGSLPTLYMVQMLPMALDAVVFKYVAAHNQMIRSCQHGFMKGRFCLTNPISFCDNVIHFVDERKAVDGFYLDVSKALQIVSYSILHDKLAALSLDGYTFHCLKK